MSTIVVEQTGKSIGAQISGLAPDELLKDESVVVTVTDALEANGVLVFRDLNLDPKVQVALCERMGEVDYSEGHHPVPGIYRVTRDAAKNSAAEYLKGTFHWHIDGCTPLHGEPPQRATMLSAKAVAESGGDTEFASTYAAYENLPAEEKQSLEGLKVIHQLETSLRPVYLDPGEERLDRWRKMATVMTHPLVWTHPSGRKSLVIGTHADRVVGMGVADGRSLLVRLQEWAAQPAFTYRHYWQPGDLVVWDNCGVMHRVVPYDAKSGRTMHRTTIMGEERPAA